MRVRLAELFVDCLLSFQHLLICLNESEVGRTTREAFSSISLVKEIIIIIILCYYLTLFCCNHSKFRMILTTFQDKFVAKLQNCSTNNSNEVTDLRDQVERQTNMSRGLEEENNRLCGDLRRLKVEGGRSKEGLLLLQKQVGCSKGEANELRLEVSRLKRIEKVGVVVL